MNRYDGVRRMKRILVAVAVLIVGASLWVSHRLITDLKAEEQTKMGVWAEAMRSLTSADETTDLNLVLRVINDNHTIPVIVTDEKGTVSTSRNLRLHYRSPEDSVKQVNEALQRLKVSGHTMRIALSESGEGSPHAAALHIYYGESLLLQRLAWFPYVQLGVVTVFLFVALLALLSTKRAEQNKVWVGLTKETAHQLGTPISSLMAWRELLVAQAVDPMVVQEMGKDIQRLEMIADRFQKIGSSPKLEPCDLGVLVMKAVAYLQPRISKGVSISVLDEPEEAVYVLASEQLIAWVFENLIKNAVDAMQSKGAISIRYGAGEEHAFIEIQDTGKGLPRAQWEKIFRPGYTTRQRGWGLGLSLARRIVQDYHKGRIYVRHSEIGVGTTFRILLTLAPSLPLSKDK